MPSSPRWKPAATRSPSDVPEIAGVILDVGGVLMLPDHQRTQEALQAVGVAADPAAIDRAHYLAISAFDGSGTADAYRSAYLEALGVPADAMARATAELFERPWPWSTVHRESVGTLRLLADRGIPIAIVSNSDGTVEERLRSYQICQVGAGSGACVTVVVDSALVGIAKPDPRIFEPALHALGLSPDRTVFVGDSVRVDVEGARAAGIRPLHFDPYRLCRANRHEDIRALEDVLHLVAG